VIEIVARSVARGRPRAPHRPGHAKITAGHRRPSDIVGRFIAAKHACLLQACPSIEGTKRLSRPKTVGDECW
jgi:hypothetical protein